MPLSNETLTVDQTSPASGQTPISSSRMLTAPIHRLTFAQSIPVQTPAREVHTATPQVTQCTLGAISSHRVPAFEPRLSAPGVTLTSQVALPSAFVPPLTRPPGPDADAGLNHGTVVPSGALTVRGAVRTPAAGTTGGAAPTATLGATPGAGSNAAVGGDQSRPGQQETGSATGAGASPRAPGGAESYSTEQRNQVLNGLLYRCHLEIRQDVLREVPGNMDAARSLAIDVGAALATVGIAVADIALRKVRETVRAGMFFSVQLLSFVHQKTPKVCYILWVPTANGICRGLMRVEDLCDFYSRVPSSVGAATEAAIVAAAVEEFLVEERLSPQKLVSINCAVAPNTWSVYENETRAHELSLTCIVPATLSSDGLMDWPSERMEVVLEFLEQLAGLRSSQSYLNRVLSSYGVVFSNLPARQSFLYWSFVGQALVVVLREHRQLARHLASSCVPEDRVHRRVVERLGEAEFRAHCHFLATVAEPLGRAMSKISEAGTLTEFLIPVLELLRWMVNELSTRGVTIDGLCWDILF